MKIKKGEARLIIHNSLILKTIFSDPKCPLGVPSLLRKASRKRAFISTPLDTSHFPCGVNFTEIPTIFSCASLRPTLPPDYGANIFLQILVTFLRARLKASSLTPGVCWSAIEHNGVSSSAEIYLITFTNSLLSSKLFPNFYLF